MSWWPWTRSSAMRMRRRALACSGLAVRDDGFELASRRAGEPPRAGSARSLLKALLCLGGTIPLKEALDRTGRNVEDEARVGT
jgi:hypothetical protein